MKSKGMIPLQVGILVVSLAQPATASMVVDEACDGRGFAGIVTKDDTVVRFESCTTPTGAYSRTLDQNGRVLVEVAIDQAIGEMRILVEGLELSDSTTSKEWALIRQTFAKPESQAIDAESLWSGLKTKGEDEFSKEMAALAPLLVVHEGMTPLNSRPGGSDCFGCCGGGCWNCTGCYTTACALHDACVASLGHGNQYCQHLLVAAALSAWCCRGVDLGPLC